VPVSFDSTLERAVAHVQLARDLSTLGAPSFNSAATIARARSLHRPSDRVTLHPAG
jgi:hypothetical protein